MNYRNLGLQLMEWHESGADPIYAVGSTMFAGHFDNNYPIDIISRAIVNLRANNDPDATKLAERLQKIVNKRVDRINAIMNTFDDSWADF